jgi:hypothetical protein
VLSPPRTYVLNDVFDHFLIPEDSE